MMTSQHRYKSSTQQRDGKKKRTQAYGVSPYDVIEYREAHQGNTMTNHGFEIRPVFWPETLHNAEAFTIK